ncbi:MAG: hypothetical protein EA349_07180 [Halomonadaceae bacterium]|nr:MAG: hypothetical protein EA349_07180 [Halomonadaceae bacterium]
MILALWRALFQATAIGLGTFGLIVGMELLLTQRVAGLSLYIITSLAVAGLVFVIRLCTLLRLSGHLGHRKTSPQNKTHH